VDPVPDPLLLSKCGSAGTRTRDHCDCSQELFLVVSFLLAFTPHSPPSWYVPYSSPPWRCEEHRPRSSSFSPPSCHSMSPLRPVLKHPYPAFLPYCQRPSFAPIQNHRQNITGYAGFYVVVATALTGSFSDSEGLAGVGVNFSDGKRMQLPKRRVYYYFYEFSAVNRVQNPAVLSIKPTLCRVFQRQLCFPLLSRQEHVYEEGCRLHARHLCASCLNGKT
jgi:hypothetical protein